MKQHQKGFGILGVFTIILVLGILTFVGWTVWHKSKTAPRAPASTMKNTQTKASSTEAKTQKYTPAIPEGWQIYKNDQLGFSFAYPKQWGELNDEAYPGGAYDASKDWILHKTSASASGSDVKGLFGKFSLDVNTKNYQEFRVEKAGTPLVYNYRDGKEFWSASASVDLESDNYKPGDVYAVPVEKTINDVKVYKLYSNYEGTVNAGWRFAIKDGIVTLNLPQLGESNMMTGEVTGDTDAYKQLMSEVLNTINIY